MCANGRPKGQELVEEEGHKLCAEGGVIIQGILSLKNEIAPR